MMAHKRGARDGRVPRRNGATTAVASRRSPVPVEEPDSGLSYESHSETLTLEPNDTQRLAILCGPFDQNLRQIERRLGVEIRNRGNAFQLLGPALEVGQAGRVLHRLYRETLSDGALTPESVHLQLQESGAEVAAEQAAQAAAEADASAREAAVAAARAPTPPGEDGLPRLSPAGGIVPPAEEGAEDPPLIRTRRKTVKPRGPNQRGYVAAIRDHDINFGIGPAGTGKTYLAVACAVEALESERVARILLVRPAVEAGEKLGFLPGDLAQKIDPYLRPLYDALYEMIGFERVHKLIERNVIEVAPLAYMRGRTLNHSFIILDESQNTTIEQMKMFLTRIGFGSTAVITGDVTQVDLPRNTRSGLLHVIRVLEGVEGITFTHFGSKDVVRHPLVQRIVEAYDRFEESTAEGGASSGGRSPDHGDR
jgi:phosphate starvation-inducible PhoH-like protein